MHNLIDFGTTLGSGATHPHARRVGNEYYIEFTPALKAAATFGIWDRPWRHVEYVEYPSIGRFESSYFQADAWRPDYPNPAFDKMTEQDALWAARTVMRFSDEAVRAIVATGQYDDPAAEAYLADALIERRDKIVRYYLSRINPVDRFRVTTGAGQARQLEFDNLGVAAGLSDDCDDTYQWFRYDNLNAGQSVLSAEATTSRMSLPIPAGSAPFPMVRLRSRCAGQPGWTSLVEIFLRHGPDPTVVGVDRADPDAP